MKEVEKKPITVEMMRVHFVSDIKRCVYGVDLSLKCLKNMELSSEVIDSLVSKKEEIQKKLFELEEYISNEVA